MKRYRRIVTSIMIILMVFMITGCKTSNHSKPASVKKTTNTTDSSFKTAYGSFHIPNGWMKNKEHSTDEKPFFVSKKYDGKGIPDNISVEYGKNHYSKDQSADFGKSILEQLNMQMQEDIDGQISASGTTTKNGDTVLVYRFSLRDRTCTQYYIVGDKSYVMVYETNMDGSKTCDKAAKEIVDSFQWS